MANAADESGWIELFDGKTLNGWVHYNGSHRYTVEDGAIVGTAIKVEGRSGNPVDPKRARALVEAACKG